MKKIENKASKMKSLNGECTGYVMMLKDKRWTYKLSECVEFVQRDAVNGFNSKNNMLNY